MQWFLLVLVSVSLLYGDAKQDDFVNKILKSSEVKIDFKALQSGKIVSIARKDQEQTNSSIALSIALYVKAPYKDVLLSLKKSEGRLSGYKNAFLVEIKEKKDIEKYFTKAYFTKDENDEVQKLLDYDKGDNFNLGKDEIAKLKTFKKDKQKLASDFFKWVLIKRTKEYMKHGVNGINAYEHCKHGDTLKDGFKKSSLGMKVFKKDFKHLYNYYVNYPNAKPTKQMSEKYFLIKDKVDDRVAFMLKHQIIEQKKNITLIAEREFYISNTLDGIQMQIICTPYKDGTLIALSSQSYTDKVSGFSRAFAIKIGREMMKKTDKAYV